MSFKFILFVLIQLLAFIFFLEMLRRVYKRATEYHLKDDRSTLPFGFIRLRYIMILYVLFYVAWIVFSIFLYSFLIDPKPTPFGIEGGGPARTYELNL